MTTPFAILGISGSLRKDSYNRMALEAAQQLLPQGVKLHIVELHGIPLFNQDEEKNPVAAVVEFKKRIRAADAILFATPEYNHGVPGVLKNAIDWGSRPPGENAWQGKPAAIISASPGPIGGLRAQYQLRQNLEAMGMYPLSLPEVMIGNAKEKFDASGNFTDEAGKKLLRQLLEKLVEWSRRLGVKDSPEA